MKIKNLLLGLFLLLPAVSGATIVDTITVEGSTVLSAGTANTVPYLNGSKSITSSAVTPTELGYLSGVSSSIQTQISAKQSALTNSAGLAAALSDETGTGLAVFNSGATLAGTTNINEILMPATVSPAVSIRMNDTDSGFGSDGDGVIYMSVNGVERMRFLPSSVTSTNPISAPDFVYPSTSQNLVLASPDGSSGTPTFRAIANGDISNAALPWALKAPITVLANPPSYGFGGGDDDTGIFSTGDGNVSIQANGVLKAEFNQNTVDFYAVSGVTNHGDLTVTGNFSAANFPFSGNAMAIAGYDNSGVQTSVPNFSYNDYNGLFLNTQAPASGDATMFSFQTATATAPAYVNGIVMNNQLESTNNTTLMDIANGAIIGVDFNGMRLFNTAAAGGGITMQSINNSGTYVGQLRMAEISNSGDGAGGLLYNFANSADMSGDFSMLNGGDNGDITGNSTLINFLKSGTVSAGFNGIGIGFNGTNIGGQATMASIGANGNPTIGGGFIGANIYSDAVVTGNSTMMFLSDSGSATDKTGLNINTTGSATGDVRAIQVNVNSVTSPNAKYTFDGQGGIFSNSNSIDTSTFTPPAFSQQNQMGGQLIIASGSPIVATPFFGNNIGYGISFDDDATADNLIGVGNSLGYSLNGFVNQIIGATGKTFDTVNYMLAAGSNPSGNGNIVNLNMFRTAGLINAGGALTATNLRGFYVDPAFDGAISSTNKWGFINASSSNNWMKGSLVLGGTTGALTGAYVLDVIGDSSLDGDVTITGAADLGNGSVAVTQSANDNSTKVATTAYADAAATAGGTAVLTSSITNGDTTHAPTGDAVFDALALKFDTASFTDAAVTGKVLTGYVSGAGTVSATDTILQAIQKLNGNIALAGSSPSANISGNTTLSYATAQYYFGDTSGGAFTATLPAASSNDGKHFFLINTDFGGSNDITVARTGGDLINGATSDTITPGETKHYASNGTNWFVF